MNSKAMFKTVVLVGLCAGLLLAGNVFARENAGNAIGNPSFEEVRRDNPARWSKRTWSGQGQLELGEGGKTGSRSVLISSESGADISWSQNVAIDPFGRYKLTGWIKTENLNKGSGAGALLNVHELQNVRTKALTGTNDWTEVEAEFEAAGNTSVLINCLFGGWGQSTGKAWYDDIKLEMLEKVTPASKTVQTQVAIDAADTFEPISEFVYGQFIEHPRRCIYGGIWAEM